LPRFWREWRNRQTRTVQVRVSERTWGFNSPLAHHQHLLSTFLGSGKDALAGRHVSPATQRHVPTLDLAALFDGRER
jgi:hypothetical protein